MDCTRHPTCSDGCHPTCSDGCLADAGCGWQDTMVLMAASVLVINHPRIIMAELSDPVNFSSTIVNEASNKTKRIMCIFFPENFDREYMMVLRNDPSPAKPPFSAELMAKGYATEKDWDQHKWLWPTCAPLRVRHGPLCLSEWLWPTCAPLRVRHGPRKPCDGVHAALGAALHREQPHWGGTMWRHFLLHTADAFQ